MVDKKIAGAMLGVMMIVSAAGCAQPTADEQELDDMEAVDAEAIDKEAQREEFSPVTPVDNDYVTLQINSITENIPADQYEWNVVVTNKTEQALTTAIRGLSVNDYVIGDPEYDGALAANEEKTVTVIFSGSDLIKNDIEEVAKASFDFYVYDEAMNVLQSASNTVYPHGEEYYSRTSRVRFTTEQTVFDNEYGTMIITGFDSYDYKYEVDFYFENKSTDGLILDVTDESGVTQSYLDGVASAETNVNIDYVPAGGRTNTEILISAEDENAEPGTVSFVFTLRNPADSSVVYTQSIEVTPW